MELATLVLEGLVSIFLSTAHTLELGEVLSARQHLLKFDVPFLEYFEFSADGFQGQSPLLLQKVVLFEASSHVSFILLVVLRDLRLPLLEDFDLKTTLPRPLLPQILIELLNRFVLLLFDI